MELEHEGDVDRLDAMRRDEVKDAVDQRIHPTDLMRTTLCHLLLRPVRMELRVYVVYDLLKGCLEVCAVAVAGCVDERHFEVDGRLVRYLVKRTTAS